MPSTPPKRRLGALTAALGVVIVVVGAVQLSPSSAADFDAPPAATAVMPSVLAPTGVADPADPSPTGTSASSHPAAATEPPAAAPTTAPPAAPDHEPAEPVQVGFERLGVSAAIEGVMTVDGVLQVPDDPQRVGWWVASSLAGSDVGTTVLDGHIDSETRGVGFFAHLGELEPGDVIVLTTSSGDELRYAVESRRTYPKSAPLPGTLFDQRGVPALVLVTCGGQFDTSRRSYQDNIAVTARPL